MTDDVRALLAERIRCADTHWHLGTFGVVAEFMRDADEPTRFPGDDGLAAFTARGAIRLEVTPDLRPFAYETAMSRARSWGQQVALCLPREACSMNRRAVLTELGPDGAAVRPHDRNGVLFDLGLDRLQVDACVRTTDAGLIETLRAAEGKPLFDFSTGALMAILKAHPHRVFLARAGRVEVYQPIPADGETSPPGPHTHVLPKLMKTGRTHGANAPIPKTLVPCGGFAPPHPQRDPMGRPRPFSELRHAAFQDVLERFGDPRLVSAKKVGLRGGLVEEAPTGRHERTAIRVGVIQRTILSTMGAG